jgi:threonine dehydratase
VNPLSLDEIRAARERIRGRIVHTPCAYSEALSDRLGSRVFVKLENLQATGAFKERGAANRLARLTVDERRRGVIAASAGNHGLGLAHQAKLLGIPAQVVMPMRAPLVKQVNVKRLGGKVVLYGDSYEEAVAHGRALAAAEDLVYVHGFDDRDVIAGQGTLGLEILEAVTDPPPDLVLVPVGGAGLIAGVGTAIKALAPQTRIIGVEPDHAASLQAALRAGHPVDVPHQSTIADGLAVSRVGDFSFQIARHVVDATATVTEDEIAQAILMLMEIEKTVVEGAGAAVLAAVLAGKVDVAGKTVVLPLCGGNIDMTAVAHILERGLARDGRLVWLRTYVSDDPGSLAHLSRLIADTRASVKDVYHNRAFGPIAAGDVEIDWVLETRGHEHIQELLDTLRKHDIRVTPDDPPTETTPYTLP